MNYLEDLLDAVEIMLRRYVVFRSEAQSSATALWICHTHVIEAADQTPYLAVTSAERRSGKTRLIEALEFLVRNPAFVSHISEAALYRTIAAERPTLLFDEIDTVFSKRANPQTEGLRALLNAGHRRGATVRRCVGDGKKMHVEKFDVFCSKLLAGIGRLPDTVSDRCIHIRLRRRDPRETVQRFRPREVEPEAADLRQAFSEWGEAHMDALSAARPCLPPQLDDRAQEGWEPLLAIADLAGGDWPEMARSAAVKLGENVAEDETLGILALTHVREAFNGAAHMTTEDLLHCLTERDDGPWADWWGRDVEDERIKGPAAKLARILKPFEITPKKFRDGNVTARGYVRDSLDPVWARYLPPSPLENMEHGTDQVATTSGVPSSVFSQGEEGAESEDEKPLTTEEIADAFNATEVAHIGDWRARADS